MSDRNDRADREASRTRTEAAEQQGAARRGNAKKGAEAAKRKPGDAARKMRAMFEAGPAKRR
ncbi:hypothetical protein [Actinomadura roseirufa]|uniref:hypothetical protein n=1 Tax=Actinomadura roseirufa TaxID=2094049 RepID=UPI0010417124|nr:hypothetical protein [Actinomadura roseirufa]